MSHRAAQPQPNPQTALQEDAESAENLSKEDSSAPLCVLLFNGLGWFENLSDAHARKKTTF